jgi:hypothetical protein
MNSEAYFELERIVKHWESYSPFIALHIHKSSGMELGRTESLCKISFEEEASEVMEKYSDIFFGEFAESATNITIIDVFENALLLKEIDKDIYFILPNPYSFLIDYDEYIMDSLYEKGYEIGYNLENLEYQWMIGFDFHLDCDFMYLEKLENIEKSRIEIQEILNQEM